MLLEKRMIYSPFEYPQAYEFWEQQQQAHWLHTEINMSEDITDWKSNLTETEKHVIGNVLKGFTQSEIFIEDYWSNKVANWFKKPEIQMMANTFASFETIHAASYSYLEESLGIQDYEAFLYEPTAKAKIDRLMSIQSKEIEEIAHSLAVFSAFNEGVNLFSSFAILLSFSLHNRLKGVGQIIAFSVRDESLHSNAGCWLFNTFVKEYDLYKKQEFKDVIYEAGRLTVELEHNFIDKCFEKGPIENVTPEQLKEFIKYRTNLKLKQLNLKQLFKINKELIEQFTWFDVLTSGVEHADFFALRPSEYNKTKRNWKKICY